MRISQLFNLDKTQYELDFVDIDPASDMQLFIDPYFLSIAEDEWSYAATTTIRNFFQQFINLVRSGRLEEARKLFSHFGEPNETCLGLSKGLPSGRGIGELNADELFESLRKSKAVATGIVEHLEDARIFVEGIGRDKVSDMATNIIREHLLAYTEDQCRLWGIPLTAGVSSGFFWSPTHQRWEAKHATRLVVGGRALLLVPKGIVSFDDRYTPNEFHNKYVLEFLQSQHLSLSSALVERRKGTGAAFVTKKKLKETESPLSKASLLEFTERHPEVFKDFREKAKVRMRRAANEGLANADLKKVCGYLLDQLTATPAGSDHASAYHKLIAGILELIFYPSLITPKLEQGIHGGRKRIDITFVNAAGDGVFHRLHAVMKIPSGYIPVECKNYSSDVANPELDQIGGRFSPNRGRVGLLISRTAEDLGTLITRCADTYKDDRGLIIPLVDDDLRTILEGLIAGVTRPEESVLEDRVRAVVMG
jgi:hypothetical protein